MSEHLVDHIFRDSTEIVAREKPVARKKTKKKEAKRYLDPAKKVRYNERAAVERVFGRLKDEFGGRMIQVRGATKVMAHLMFGILALTADQLL